jgi:DNA-binding NarL/FixJ family response regulator
MDAARVLVVGAQRASIEALATALGRETGINAVGVLTHVPDVAAAVRKSRASVVLIEGTLLADDPTCQPVRDALEASAKVKVVVLGGHLDVALWALCEGASGYIPDDAQLSDVVEAVLQVALFGAALSPAIQRLVLLRYQEVGPGRVAGDKSTNGLLTVRELEIVRLIANGGTNNSVASDCGISESTVKNHLANIFRKLGACSRSQMVAEAFRRGLLNPGD